MMQKDAIMIAILKEHGGIFMDIDTLVLSDITPVIDYLQKSEMIMFDSHIAFIGARTNSLVISKWLSGIRSRLQMFADQVNSRNFNVGFFGNEILEAVLEEICENSLLDRILYIQRYDEELIPTIFRSLITSLVNQIKRGRRFIYFKTKFKKFIWKLNRNKYGYIQERLHIGRNKLTDKEKYIQFWFDAGIDVQTILATKPMVIGLHNSWTPDWYRELSTEDVLNNDVLLSRILKTILEIV